MPDAADFSANQDRFTGFAELYDRHRPMPPAELHPLLLRFCGLPRFSCVVDLGSGTGLSTRYWAARAERVIGVEPTPDMRRQAEAASGKFKNIAYQDGLSHATGLPDACADLVSCSQDLHWMDPQGTFAEAKRILRAGGIFAANDYDWPPSAGTWELDAAWHACLERVREFEKRNRSTENLRFWHKDGHFARMQSSGCFRHVKDTAVHHPDQGNAERLIGLLLSQGNVMDQLKRGVSESDLAIDRFRDLAHRILGSTPAPWLWTSRVRMGIVAAAPPPPSATRE